MWRFWCGCKGLCWFFIMNSDSNGFEMSLCSSWSAHVAFFPAEGLGVLFLNKLRHDHISIPQLQALKNLTALLSPDSVGNVIGARVNQHLLAHHEGWKHFFIGFLSRSLTMVISYVLTIPHVRGDLVATKSPLRNYPLIMIVSTFGSLLEAFGLVGLQS